MPNWVGNSVAVIATAKTTVALKDIANALRTNCRDKYIADIRERIAKPEKRKGWETLKMLKDELKDALKRCAASFENAFDFNSIVPMPEDSPTFKAEGGLSSADLKKFGRNNWYAWSREHWGTKWNSRGAQRLHLSDTALLYTFETAWGTPEAAVKALSEKYHVRVECNYHDEDDFGQNIGTYTYDDGELVSQEDMTEQWDRIAEYFGEGVMEDHGMKRNRKGKWVYQED